MLADIHYSISTPFARALQRALSRIAVPWNFLLSTQKKATTMKDLVWRADVSHDGKRVGYQENGWFALPDEEVSKMQTEGTNAVMYAKKLEEKGGKEYRIEFTGGTTDTETGAEVDDPPIAVELSGKNLTKYLDEAGLPLTKYLVDWAKDDVQHGKKTGWDHSKAKEHKPKPKE